MKELHNNPLSWQQKSWLAFQTAIQNIKILLERQNDSLEDGFSSDSRVTLEPPRNSGLGQLRSSFQLTDFELFVITLAAAVEFDAGLSHICGKIHQNPAMKFPTFRLAMIVFPNIDLAKDTISISPNSTLRKWGLIELETSNNYRLDKPFRINERVLDFILGYPDIDRALSAYIKPVSTAVNFADIDNYNRLAQQIASTLGKSDENSLIQISGTDSVIKTQMLALACQLLERPLYQTNLGVLPEEEKDLDYLVNSWAREAKLGGCLLLIHCEEYNSQSPSAASLNRLLMMLDAPVVLGVNQRLNIVSSRDTLFEIPSLSNAQQRYLWQQSLRSSVSDQLDADEIEPIIANFRLTPQGIKNATFMALSQSHPGDDLAQSLWNACRVQARTSLDNLAQRLDAKATWDDLILSSDRKKLLAEIISQVRQKTLVYEHWGFGGKSNRGYGICALFAGVSGTGKTMAAEVIAGELNLDLYRIDLSTVVSKYIGETEKNLSRLFDAAEKGGAILLFDEADSLFGKRTEVTDAKDKYANMEVSYLLQRMEAYRGLAILTTNIKDALDSAFKRRLRFIVDFAFPDVATRTKMWQRVFPAKTPTKSLDFQALARLDLTGGNIRSIALNAAFEAAQDSESVMMKHIAIAAEKESLKLGLGNWALSKVFPRASENTDNQPGKNRESQQARGKTYGEEDLSLEQLIKFASLKLQQEDYDTAYRLARKAVAKNPHDSTANYWWGWTGYHLERPLEELLSAFSTAEHGNQEWWRVREGKAATWYWQGKINSLQKAEPQTIMDFYQRYLDDFPRGYYAAEAMQAVQNAKMELLFGKPPE